MVYKIIIITRLHTIWKRKIKIVTSTVIINSSNSSINNKNSKQNKSSNNNNNNMGNQTSTFNSATGAGAGGAGGTGGTGGGSSSSGKLGSKMRGLIQNTGSLGLTKAELDERCRPSGYVSL